MYALFPACTKNLHSRLIKRIWRYCTEPLVPIPLAPMGETREMACFFLFGDVLQPVDCREFKVLSGSHHTAETTGKPNPR
jgi:hypothetical protein